MDPTGGKAGDPQRRSSTRVLARSSTINTSDNSYQPNTGLIIPDEDDFDDLAAASRWPTESPSQSRSATGAQVMANRPSSMAKSQGHDHLALNSSFASVARGAGPSLSVSGSRPDGSSRGPTHQYGLFQNTVPVEELPDITEMVPDSMGGYRRRIDSVETETVASLSHSEDLPPYTRYPEDAYLRRQEPSGPLGRTPSTRASSSLSSSFLPRIPAGAGGLGLATRNPEYDPSTDDLNSPGSRLSTRSLSNESHHEINVAAKLESEKPPGSIWQKRARKRIWGVVPYWAACLVAVALLLVGVVLGAVVGTFLGKQDDDDDNQDNGGNIKGPKSDPHFQPAPIHGSDVIALTSLPQGLPPLPTGCYTLSQPITRTAPATCFADQAQNESWSCNIPFALYYMQVDKLVDAPNTTDHVLTLTTYDYHNNTQMPKYPWGAGPPVITSPVQLQLVTDIFEANQGPAWWARVTYNKTVIIGDDKLTPTALRRRSGLGGWGGGDDIGGDRDVSVDGDDYDDGISFGAVEGDRPWICTWPDTVLEVFIYPEQQAAEDDDSGASLSYESPTATARGLQDIRSTAVSPPASAPTNWPPFDDMPARPETYPKVFKLKERRVAELGSSTASCRQVQIVAKGQDDVPVLDSAGQPVEVVLVETEESLVIKRWHEGKQVSESVRRDPKPLGDELTDCGCLWWVF